MIRRFKIGLILVLFLITAFFNLNIARAASVSDYPFPRRANIFLNWTMTSSQARELAKWDLLVLDMELQYRHPDLLKKIRVWNPDIIMLVYITPQEIKDNASTSYSFMRRQFASGISDIWYLKNSSGKKLSWWPETYLLNITNNSPLSGGERFNEYLVDFVVGELLSTRLWDGVFYDNAWDNITWFAGGNIDLNGDGWGDSNLDQSWQEGLKFIYNKTRDLTSNKYLIVGNNDTKYYADELNGMLLENFNSKDWEDYMARYRYNEDNRQDPIVDITNFNTKNTGNNQDYQAVRYGLATTLLEDGYFSFDHGDESHGQTWWYDEYDVGLGDALGDSISDLGYSNYKEGVWKRSFENGLALVNSSDKNQTVDLGGEYEKIHGQQDTKINDGSIVSEVDLDSEDGLILLKTFEGLNDVLFRNGDFVRFLRSDGSRARNGFFVFEDKYSGGQKIAHVDLDGNGQRDLLVVKGNKIMVWRDDGLLYAKVYPYTANYQGELEVSLGDLNNDSNLEIYVSPSPGYPAPIKIYTRHGRQMKHDWYPFGTAYSGGYNIAVGNLDGRFKNELIVAAGTGMQPAVNIYDWKYNELYSWLAFEYWFRGGVNVASGDVDGDGVDEVVVGAGEGKKPVVKIFDWEGGEEFPEFEAYSSFVDSGIEVDVLDVDYDGVDEIVGWSSSL